MYKDAIKKHLRDMGFFGYDPRHIEAYMRLEHPTLDSLSSKKFKSEVKLAVYAINVDGVENAESLALSYGL